MKKDEFLNDGTANVRYISAQTFYKLAAEAIQNDNQVVFSPTGQSMRPTLRNQKDEVFLEKAPQYLKKLDIILYRRANGKIVLHRIVGIDKNSSGEVTYILCGDGQTALEFGIKRSQILAVVCTIIRDGRCFNCAQSRIFRLYSRFWVASRPFRAVIAFILKLVKIPLKFLRDRLLPPQNNVEFNDFNEKNF